MTTSTKKQINIRADPETIRQMRELARTWGTNETGTIARAIERIYQQERIHMDTKVIPFPVPDDPAGRTANAVIKDWRSPTGAWCAEWDEQTQQAMPLTDEDGDFIPAPRAYQQEQSMNRKENATIKSADVRPVADSYEANGKSYEVVFTTTETPDYLRVYCTTADRTEADRIADMLPGSRIRIK